MANPKLTSEERHAAEKRILNEWLARDYEYLITHTAADGSFRDIDFIRAASSVLIYVNEHLFGRIHGPKGNGKHLRGLAFVERQERRKGSSLGASSQPLPVYLLVQPVDLEGVPDSHKSSVMESALRQATAQLIRPTTIRRFTTLVKRRR